MRVGVVCLSSSLGPVALGWRCRRCARSAPLPLRSAGVPARCAAWCALCGVCVETTTEEKRKASKPAPLCLSVSVAFLYISARPQMRMDTTSQAKNRPATQSRSAQGTQNLLWRGVPISKGMPARIPKLGCKTTGTATCVGRGSTRTAPEAVRRLVDARAGEPPGSRSRGPTGKLWGRRSSKTNPAP